MPGLVRNGPQIPLLFVENTGLLGSDTTGFPHATFSGKEKTSCPPEGYFDSSCLTIAPSNFSEILFTGAVNGGLGFTIKLQSAAALVFVTEEKKKNVKKMRQTAALTVFRMLLLNQKA